MSAFKIRKKYTNFPSIVTSAFKQDGNFANKKNRMMERQMHIPTELYEDEVVSFLADRYHSTPDEIVQCFLAQDG